MAMIEGKTPNGFEFKVDEDALNDFEILEDIESYQNGNQAAIISLSRRFLGIQQYESLKEFTRGENGRVSATEMDKEITAIMNAVRGLKNS